MSDVFNKLFRQKLCLAIVIVKWAQSRGEKTVFFASFGAYRDIKHLVYVIVRDTYLEQTAAQRPR